MGDCRKKPSAMSNPVPRHRRLLTRRRGGAYTQGCGGESLKRARAKEPLYLAVTADVDPDANRPARGRPDAVSAGRPAEEAAYDACFQGLALLLGVLERLSLPASLFWEARCLERLASREPALLARALENPLFEHGGHGWRHEDFAGRQSGMPLGPEETERVLSRAAQVFGSVLRRTPLGFRAPYCRLTPELARALPGHGYLYDASVARRPGTEWQLQPYRLDLNPALWEVALCRGTDRRGQPISGYLWQLLEGNRQVSDYLDLVQSLRDRAPGGLLQIALHPWHLVVSEKGAPFGAGGSASRVEKVEELLQGIRAAAGVETVTVGGYLASRLGPSDAG